MSALLSLAFVLNDALVGTRRLRRDKVSECVRCVLCEGRTFVSVVEITKGVLRVWYFVVLLI